VSGLRFKVGDLVRLVVATLDDLPVTNGCIGTIAEIAIVEDHPDGWMYDYGVDFPEDEDLLCIDDWQLQPINPPAEPASLTRQTDCEVEA